MKSRPFLIVGLLWAAACAAGCDAQRESETPRALGRHFEVDAKPRKSRSLIDRAREPESTDDANAFNQPTAAATADRQINVLALRPSQSLGDLTISEATELSDDGDPFLRGLDSRFLEGRNIETSYKEHVERGQAELKRGEIDRALLSFEEAKAINSRHYEAYFLESECYVRKKDYGKALAAINFALEIDAEQIDFYKRRAQIQAALGRFLEAVADLNRLLADDPKSVEALVFRSGCYDRIGDKKAAMDDLSRAITAAPNDAALRYRRGLSYYAQRQFKEAAADATWVIDRHPGAMEGYQLRAICRFHLKDLDGGRADFDQGVRLGMPAEAVANLRPAFYPNEAPVPKP